MTTERMSDEFDWRMRVFDSLSFPTLILEPNRKIVFVNQIFLKKIGKPLEGIVGKTCREVFQKYYHDPGLPCHEEQCPLSIMLQDRKGHSVLRKYKNRSGEEIWEDRVFSPILDDNGEVKYIIESVRDVTRVKTLEQMFTGMREFMGKIIQSSPSAIISADRSGRIILMNPEAEKLFGYSFEEVGRITIQDLYPNGAARDIMKMLREKQHGEKGKLPITKVNIVNKYGEEIPVEMTAAIIYEGDREAATMGIYNDLREKVAVEKKLQEVQQQVVQSEKMASLGRLAAGVAHEINNPLTSILLYGNMMLEKMEQNCELRENLEYVIEDADRCREIVKSLLAYSRQEVPSMKVIQINALVEDSLHLIRDPRLFMNVDLVKELSAELIQIHADKSQLQQVIINLVINAIDAMDGKGKLTIRTYRQQGKAFIEVADTGNGIAKTDIQKVFDPFFTTKKPGKGTGLGLSTAYGIVKKNKGSIRVKETGPEGTTMLLEIQAITPISELPFESIG